MTSITDHGLPTLHALRAAYANGSLTPSDMIMQLLARIAKLDRPEIWISRVDEAALLAAVQSRQVFAAGLDSFAVEPMTAPHIFHNAPHIILSPHIGGVTGDAYINMGVGAARNVLDVLAKATA